MWRAGVALCALVSVAHAEPVVLRMAVIIPDGTPWAHAFKEAGAELSRATAGRLQMKWYMSGIAGDEPEMLERIKRGQLDGAAFTLVCDRLAPSLKAMRLVDDRAQHEWVMEKLRPRIDQELEKVGLVGFGLANLGTSRLFTRQRITTVDELKRVRLWVWSLDDAMRAIGKRLGLALVPMGIDEGRAAADAGKIDGFIAPPSAMLAYQWSARMRYFTPELHFGSPNGCLVLTKKLFERLHPEDRVQVRTGLEKLVVRIAELLKEQDDKLLGGLFQKQGLTPVTSAETSKALPAAAARGVRDAVSDLVSPEVVGEVDAFADQYRAKR